MLAIKYISLLKSNTYLKVLRFIIDYYLLKLYYVV